MNAARYVQPTVRTWQGLSALGRLDWRLSASTQVAIRLAGAKWDEKAPLLGNELQNGAGMALDGRDLSVALAATTASESRRRPSGQNTNRPIFNPGTTTSRRCRSMP